MSKNLSAAAVASFHGRVKTAYEKGKMLRGTVTLKTGVIGTTHRFTRVGKGMSQRRVPQTDVVPMNLAYNTTTAVLEDWNAAEYTDIFDAPTVDFNEREILAGIISSAQGRREDQLIIDALEASSTLNAIPDAGSGLTTAKCVNMKKIFDKAGVPPQDRKALCGVDSLNQLIHDPEATTIEKNMIKTLVNGEISKWLGFEFMQMEDRLEGGLPVTASIQTNYFYHPSAVGLAIGLDHRTEVNYIPTKTSWLANGIVKAGAVHIDAVGIGEVDTVI